MNRITNRKTFAAATLGAALLTVAAAAGGVARAGSTQAGSTPERVAGTPARAAVGAAPTATDPRSGGLQVALGEWSVGLEAKAVRPGRVTFVITNRGKVVHGFEIEVADDRRDGDKTETGRLRPGETVRLTLELKPGTYKVECSVGDHDERGMVARLSVRADAPLVSAPKAQPNVIRIENFAFKPVLVNARVGATVRWRNDDSAPHTATASDRSFDSKTLGRGAGYSHRFTRAGTYAYICALHPQMKGKVVVR